MYLQPLLRKCHKYLHSQCVASIKDFSHYKTWKPEQKINFAKKVHCQLNMAHEALMGIVHIERQSSLECPVCMDELPEVLSTCCFQCSSLLCPGCTDRVTFCPTCRNTRGYIRSMFVNFLIMIKNRSHSESEYREE